jgi:hypothetical protein
MRQAPMTAQTYLTEAIQIIDDKFGEGYAKSHPAIVGAFIQTCAADYAACFTADHLEEIANALNSLADAMRGYDYTKEQANDGKEVTSDE